MNKPVLKDVLPLYTSVSHSYENDPGMVSLNEVWEKSVEENLQLRSPLILYPLCEIEHYYVAQEQLTFLQPGFDRIL